MNNVDENKEAGMSDLIEHDDMKQATLYSEEEREAIKQKAISDGCLIEPLVKWKSKNVLVWGYEERAIAQELNLPYEVKEIEFESVTDCLAWIGERKLATPSLNGFQRTKIGLNFWEFWKDKDEAKYGEKSPLKKAAFEKYGRADKLAIIAIKAGISHNSVNKVCRILESGDKNLIADCLCEEISINAAYNLVNDGTENEDPDDAEDKKTQRKKEQKQKEVNTLAKYYSTGFSNTKEKLDEHGLKFFILRWNEEHPQNKITSKQVKKAIDVLGKDKK